MVRTPRSTLPLTRFLSWAGGGRLLHAALIAGDSYVVSQVIGLEEKVPTQDRELLTRLLPKAIAKRDARAVERILAAGADPRAPIIGAPEDSPQRSVKISTRIL